MTSAIRITFFFLVLAGFALTTSGLRTELRERANRASEHNGPIYLPRAELLRPFSLGYQNVLADILWFRAISYFGEHYRSDRTYTWLAHICDLVTNLDPKAEHVYRFAGLILPWEAGDVDKGIELLEKGTRALPQSWELAYYLGFTRFFFKDDKQNAARDLQRASSLPGAHPGIASLAATLTRETSGPEATLAFLSDLDKNVDSPRVREVIGRNMREAAAARAINEINLAAAKYREMTGREPKSVEDLHQAGYLPGIPQDPFGGRFILGADGAKSSTGEEPGKMHVSRVRKRALEGKRGDQLFGD